MRRPYAETGGFLPEPHAPGTAQAEHLACTHLASSFQEARDPSLTSGSSQSVCERGHPDSGRVGADYRPGWLTPGLDLPWLCSSHSASPHVCGLTCQGTRSQGEAQFPVLGGEAHALSSWRWVVRGTRSAQESAF